MKTRTFVHFRTARQFVSVLLILGLAFALWPAQLAHAGVQPYAERGDVLASSMAISLSDLTRMGDEGSVGLGPVQAIAAAAQPSVYLYTITLP
ncbi:MAG: hypothetical protein ACK2UX_02540, partial [Anaerolineae bacterium]